MTRRYYAVLAKVSLSYPPLKGRLVTCYSPVRHFTHGLLHFLVRLACVRHAASVDSEPGSNSRLKPDCFHHTDGGRMASAASRARKLAMPYLVRMIKPNLIYSHNWHVQPNCQRSLRDIRLSGSLLGSRPSLSTELSSNLLRSPTLRLTASVGVFARTF